MRFLRLHKPGYRIWKTVIAATLTLLVCSRFSQMSPALALMGVYCAMERTIKASWHACLNQFVGVLVGSVLGFFLLRLLPQPPLWLMGLSLFVVIGVCNLLHVSYAVFLSSIIFISVCTGASAFGDILARIRDVSLGLAFGLLVNILVHPYSNERKIAALLEKLQRQSLLALEQIVVDGRYPDLRGCEEVREQLSYELEQTRAQRVLLKSRRFRNTLAWEEGCVQLGMRMMQELQALGTMDAFGRIWEDNAQSLHALGIDAQGAKLDAGREEDVVMNYHVACFCRACEFLTQLLPLWQPQTEKGKTEPETEAEAEPESEPERNALDAEHKSIQEERSYETTGAGGSGSRADR